MTTNDKIDEILEELARSGSVIDYLQELKDESAEQIKGDRDLSEVLRGIASDVELLTKNFLEIKNVVGNPLITGISTGIYLPDYNGNGSYKYTVLGGTTKRHGENITKVDPHTVFDLASVTKLYTLVLAFKLEELGLLQLDVPISKINPDFQSLSDYTINDLIRLHGILRTDGNVAAASTYEEALERFKTCYLYTDDRTKNTYNDFGAMIIADTIEKVVSKELGRTMKFDDIMNEFLFAPLFIDNTTFTPGIINISGNENEIGLPHDPKSRILGGVTGHAGLFSDSESLYRLADGLLRESTPNKPSYLSEKHIARLGETTFPESKSYTKGNLGLYLHDKTLATTFTPPEFSEGSFSHQGWTGALASFDPVNKIHNNILVNAVDPASKKYRLNNDKPIGYSDQFGLYQSEIVKRIMLMYVVKKYYNKYCNVKENIEETVIIPTKMEESTEGFGLGLRHF